MKNCSSCSASLMPTMRMCPTCGGKEFSFENNTPIIKLSKEKKDKELEDKAYECAAKGVALWRIDDLDGALEHYLKAVGFLKSRMQAVWVVEDLDLVEGLGHIFRAKGNYYKAIEYYKEAWEDPEHLFIGHVYYENLKDYNKASKIYLNKLSLNADRYYVSAAFNLARMNWKGEGGPQSYIVALKWMNIADSMNPDCVEFLEFTTQLKKEMTSQGIENANLLAIDWLKSRDKAIHELWKNDPWANVGL